MEDAPGDDHVHSQTGFNAVGAGQLALFDLAAALESAMVDLNAPAPGVPVQLFDRLRDIGHRAGRQQHPTDRFDTFRSIDLLSQHGPQCSAALDAVFPAEASTNTFAKRTSRRASRAGRLLRRGIRILMYAPPAVVVPRKARDGPAHRPSNRFCSARTSSFGPWGSSSAS